MKHGSLEEYWSTSPLLRNQVASKAMPRNRFQILLSCVHFADNDAMDHTDRLWKIRPIIDQLQTNFQFHYVPGEIFSLTYSSINADSNAIFFSKQEK